MKYFKCGKCDKILEKKYAGNHPHSELTWLNVIEARDHDKEERVKELEKEDGNENEIKKKEEELETAKAELRKKTPEELDEILESLRAEIEELKKPKKETKEARSRYDVLGYNQMYSASSSGDRLFQDLGSRD